LGKFPLSLSDLDLGSGHGLALASFNVQVLPILPFTVFASSPFGPVPFLLKKVTGGSSGFERLQISLSSRSDSGFSHSSKLSRSLWDILVPSSSMKSATSHSVSLLPMAAHLSEALTLGDRLRSISRLSENGTPIVLNKLMLSYYRRAKKE
jgi:hypothetical protein